MKEQIQKTSSFENNVFPFKTEFEKDVYEGLRSSPKKLKSKYFYDSTGDEIFQKIMKLPEYYLTNSEFEILQTNKNKISDILRGLAPFLLVDLGAGDAKKTKVILQHFIDKEMDFTYVPVDISPDAIYNVTLSLAETLPDLEVSGISGDYMNALNSLPQDQNKVILFLGSSIGNFTKEETLDFLKGIFLKMNPNDLLITGFDLKKDPEIILAAYNDRKGITAQFNLNLLRRINRELDANFDLSLFDHYPSYHQEEGEARSALVSLQEQQIFISTLDLNIELARGEKIHTEISSKFDFEEIENFANLSGFEVVENLTDSRNYFSNSIWRKKA